MWRGMRGMLVALAALVAASAQAADLGTMKVGVLKFGTVSWELDVIKARGLDAKEGFTLKVVPFGANDAADVALMGVPWTRSSRTGCSSRASAMTVSR